MSGRRVSKKLSTKELVENIEEFDDIDQAEEVEKVDKGKRRRSKNDEPAQDFNDRCEDLKKRINESMRQFKMDINELQKLHQTAMKDAGKAPKKKKEPKKTGFTRKEQVPEKLAEFVGIDKDIEMSRTQLTRLIYDELKKRGLCYDKDRRVLRADKEVQNLFNIPESVNDSVNAKDKNAFNFYNLQSYVGKCYKDQKDKDEQLKKKNSSKLTLEL